MICLPNSRNYNLREQKLEDELLRIRNTYSFKLGLLLTKSFIRKPWLLPLLPFTFIKMNVNYVKDRKKITRSTLGREFELDRDCILIFPTSEEGMAVVERAISIAKEWIDAGRKAIIISTNDLMAKNIPTGALFYPLTDPKNIDKQERTVWNGKCANMIGNIIELHKPISVVFDGPFPYRGLIDILNIKKNVVWTWLRIEDSKEDFTSEYLDSFDLSYFGLVEQLFSEQKERIEVNSIYSSKVLLAIDYNKKKMKGWDKYSFLINKLNKEKIETVIPAHSTIDTSQLYVTEAWNSISVSFDISTLYAAIVKYDSFLISKLMQYGIPTICIINGETNTIVDSFKLKSVNYPLIMIKNGDDDEMELAISTIVNRENNKAMRTTPIYISPLNWSSFFEEIQSLAE